MKAVMRKETIGAIVTTLNEENDIGDCIRSLEWCDDLLVVDSYSTDRTLEIVRGFPKVRREQRTYYGSAAQKNWAMDQCDTDWILIFDADERCTRELRREIEALFENGLKYDSYRIRRRLFFLNRHIQFCGWHRDLVVRLTRSGTARYPNRRVHADMVTTGPAAILKNPMDHLMVRDLNEYTARVCKYGVWGAAQGWKDKRSSGPLQVVFRPFWRFFRSYFVQLGFLDGLHGFVFCCSQALGTFVKWTVLWGWNLTGEPSLPEFDESEDTWRVARAGEKGIDDGRRVVSRPNARPGS